MGVNRRWVIAGGLAAAGAARAQTAVPARTVVTLTPAQLDALVGNYEISPAVIVAVTREGSRLYARLNGQEAAEVFPASPTEVFWKAADVQATFELRPDGVAARLVLHQNGQDVPATRAP